LFLDILSTLEDINAPYVVIGAFAANIYGSTRVTYDIDIVVNLSEVHITGLVDAYPLPRYYADPVQMRDSIRLGMMFNIIDTSRKHLHIPPSGETGVWCARPDDVILGKLMAWNEGRSLKHESDIRDMLVAHYLGADPESAGLLDEDYIATRARALGDDALRFWLALRAAARRAVEKESGHQQ
jgi:hypothetical protein